MSGSEIRTVAASQVAPDQRRDWDPSPINPGNRLPTISRPILAGFQPPGYPQKPRRRVWLKNTTCGTIRGQLGDHTTRGVNTHTLMDKLHDCVTTLVSTTDITGVITDVSSGSNGEC